MTHVIVIALKVPCIVNRKINSKHVFIIYGFPSHYLDFIVRKNEIQRINIKLLTMLSEFFRITSTEWNAWRRMNLAAFFWTALFSLAEGCPCRIRPSVDAGKLGSVWFSKDKWRLPTVTLMRCKPIVSGKRTDPWCHFVRILSIYLIQVLLQLLLMVISASCAREWS